MHTQVKKISFVDQKVDVGIDVHKKNWRITVAIEGQPMSTFSQDPEPALLIKYLHKNFQEGDYRLAYEAGFSGFWIQRAFEKAGMECLVLHAADIPTTDKERTQKEDSRDSRKIALCLYADNFNAIHVPDEKQEDDRCLLRVRAMHVKDQTRLKNRIKASLHSKGVIFPEEFMHPNKHWSRPFLAYLHNLGQDHQIWQGAFGSILVSYENIRTEILNVNRAIRSLARTDAYRALIEALLSIPGIGMVTAMSLLTELGDIRRFKGDDQLNSYLGLVPSTHSSGDNERTGSITKRRNARLRNLLVESSWVAIRNDPSLALAYGRYVKRMKSQEAIIRIAKKLARRIRCIMINGCMYQKGVA